MSFSRNIYFAIQAQGGKEWVTTPARAVPRISSSRPPHLYSSEGDAKGALRQLIRALNREDLEVKEVVVWEHVKMMAE